MDHVVWIKRRGGSTLGKGGTSPSPDSLVAPDSKARWPFWRDLWGPKSKFSGVPPRTPLEELTALPIPLSCGEGVARCPLPRTPSTLSAFYGSQGLTHYRVGNSTTDRFQMHIWTSFFRFRRMEKMDSVMKGLMRAMHPSPQNFWAPD